VTAAFAGLCVGSFLNVVIHRLPRMMEAQWRAECAALARDREAARRARRRPTTCFTPPRVPVLRHAHPRVPEHPRGELARAARALRELPRADQLPLSRRRDAPRCRRGC
jgi:prepilin signal peptidase PulO-like enzyme (type II secretory pathway)